MSNESKFKVTLGQYKGLKASRPSSAVTDEELEKLYDQQARVFAQRIEVKDNDSFCLHDRAYGMYKAFHIECALRYTVLEHSPAKLYVSLFKCLAESHPEPYILCHVSFK